MELLYLDLARIMVYSLGYFGWILTTYDSFSRLTFFLRILFSGVIAGGIGFLWEGESGGGVLFFTFWMIVLIVFDKNLLISSRRCKDQLMKKELGFMNSEEMPLLVIISLNILIFLFIFAW